MADEKILPGMGLAMVPLSSQPGTASELEKIILKYNFQMDHMIMVRLTWGDGDED